MYATAIRNQLHVHNGFRQFSRCNIITSLQRGAAKYCTEHCPLVCCISPLSIPLDTWAILDSSDRAIHIERQQHVQFRARTVHEKTDRTQYQFFVHNFGRLRTWSRYSRGYLQTSFSSQIFSVKYLLQIG